MRPKSSHLYWIVLIIVFLPQLLMTLNSFNQLRFEEVDAISDAFWFGHRLIELPGHTNVGWSGSLLVINTLFGFDIFNGKYFRLFLYFVSMFCLADMFKRLLGIKGAIIPLLTIGLSPTFLFFNTLTVPYGVDLLYFPISLYLILGSGNKILSLAKTTFGWFIVMLAWLSYPAFVFYLPVLAIVYLSRLAAKQSNVKLTSVLLSTVAFFIPLILIYFYIQNKDLLFDYSNQQGLFLANSGGNFELSFHAFFATLAGLANNLFMKVDAYHFEVSQGEFFGLIPIITLLTSIILPIKFMGRFKEIKFLAIITVIMALANVIVVSLSLQGPGAFRRNTPLLAALYGFYVISFYLIHKKGLRFLRPAWLMNTILAIFLIHHLIVYPINLNSLTKNSPFRQNIWFSQEDTPKNSIDKLMSVLTDKDLYLNCNEEYHSNDTYCPYTPTFAILNGECAKRKANCHQIFGYFPIERVYHELNWDLLFDYDQQRIY